MSNTLAFFFAAIMKFKWIYLFLAFLLPIGLTFFLKIFGKSEFNIPVYYETETPAAPCAHTYKLPYVLPDSVFTAFSSGINKPTLFTTDTSSEASKNFRRLQDEMPESSYNFILLKENKNLRLLSCVLIVKKPWTTVLIDDQKRIRGYYSPHMLEEADRLIAEMKILLKNY